MLILLILVIFQKNHLIELVLLSTVPSTYVLDEK